MKKIVPGVLLELLFSQNLLHTSNQHIYISCPNSDIMKYTIIINSLINKKLAVVIFETLLINRSETHNANPFVSIGKKGGEQKCA